DYSLYKDRAIKGNTLNKSKLNKILIPLPPLQEQEKIASILSVIDENIEVYERKKKTLDELFRSMLQNLMTGKIRVKDLDF
ncbi:MAG: restriction endonuclease subunit S, partial [Candidatus Woesearchaeota archaeon]